MAVFESPTFKTSRIRNHLTISSHSQNTKNSVYKAMLSLDLVRCVCFCYISKILAVKLLVSHALILRRAPSY